MKSKEKKIRVTNECLECLKLKGNGGQCNGKMTFAPCMESDPKVDVKY